MRLPIFQVDSFTSQRFAGNPAAVVPLDDWLPDELLQAIAAENNLSETAYVVRQGADYALRWFTPVMEADLCGHATLATAWVIFHRLEPGRQSVSFETRWAGRLAVERRDPMLAMDFPSWPPQPVPPMAALAQALGAVPQALFKATRDHMALFETADDVRRLRPDFRALRDLDVECVIVTASGSGDCDFVSRFFSPRGGIDEDPVTGSAHSTLVPYWSKRLGKQRLHARQLSRRGGDLFCAMKNARVEIAGEVAPYLEGWIEV
jgi:PhzF family phenazine biosynthesis protein